MLIVDVDEDIPKELWMYKHEHLKSESFQIAVFQYKDQLPTHDSAM